MRKYTRILKRKLLNSVYLTSSRPQSKCLLLPFATLTKTFLKISNDPYMCNFHYFIQFTAHCFNRSQLAVLFIPIFLSGNAYIFNHLHKNSNIVLLSIHDLLLRTIIKFIDCTLVDVNSVIVNLNASKFCPDYKYCK